MKIPASKVPAQVWADKMRTEGDLSEAESERLRRWDSSKQVYRVNSTLWVITKTRFPYLCSVSFHMIAFSSNGKIHLLCPSH